MYALDDSIVISLIGAGVAVMTLFARLLYKSKCSTIDIGCIHVQRNVKAEMQQQDFFSELEIGNISPK